MIRAHLLTPFAVSQLDSSELTDTLHHAVQTAHHAADHHEEAHELPNIIMMLYKAFGDAFKDIHHWENIIFAFGALLFLCTIAVTVYSRRQLIPGKLQNAVEFIVEALYNFFRSILGEHARKYTPFLGTLFVYILVINWMGLIPLLKSPSSSATITVSLALVVFFYSQAVGFRHLGVGGWLFHLAGEPRGVLGWALVPLNLPIHLVGELAKPVSLSLRLFGNITGEDILIAAFTGIGLMALSFVHSPVGIPFQFPFYFFGAADVDDTSARICVFVDDLHSIDVASRAS